MDKKTKIIFNILAVILIAIFCIALTPITLQNDTYYTIKVGEHIMQNGIDMMDPFSWHENLPYTYPHWAYDVMTYLVYNIGGFLGVYILTAILAAILGISIYFVNAKLTKNNILSFIITIGAMFLLKDYIAARAQLLTFILFIWTIYCIEQFLATKKKRYAIGLFIIPTIIANFHLAVWPFFFVLFMPYIGEYIIALLGNLGITLRKWKIKKIQARKIQTDVSVAKVEEIQNKIHEIEERKKKMSERAYKLQVVKNDNVKWLIVIMLICVVTGLLTPLHGTPYTYLYDTLRGNTTQFINEHLPLTLINDINFLCLIVLFIAILMFTDTKIRLRDLFMTGGLLLLALKTRRQTSMFILICSLVLNRLITSIFDKYDKGGVEKFTEKVVTLPGKIITIGIVAILCYGIIKPKIGNTFVDKSSYPVEAAQFIKENIDMENMRLFNEYNYGSYLLMQDIPVFIDSRCDLYTKEYNKVKDIFSDFINIANIGLHYEDKFEEYDITHVIVHKNARLNLFLPRDNKYKQLYSDNYFCVYERMPEGAE